MIDLGICYQVTINQKLVTERNRPPTEDFSNIGFNAESKKDEDNSQKPWEFMEVVSNKEKLLAFSQWMLSMKTPTKITRQFDGPMVTAYVDKKRRFIVRGDDIPFGINAMNVRFSCEHIHSIEVPQDTNLLVIKTDFGQTAVMIPNVSNGA